MKPTQKMMETMISEPMKIRFFRYFILESPHITSEHRQGMKSEWPLDATCSSKKIFQGKLVKVIGMSIWVIWVSTQK